MNELDPALRAEIMAFAAMTPAASPLPTQNLTGELLRYFGRAEPFIVTTADGRRRRTGKVDETDLSRAMAAAGVRVRDGQLSRADMAQTIKHAKMLGLRHLLAVLTGVGDGGGTLFRVSLQDGRPYSDAAPLPVDPSRPDQLRDRVGEQRRVIPSTVTVARAGSTASMPVDSIELLACLDLCPLPLQEHYSPEQLQDLSQGAEMLGLTQLASRFSALAEDQVINEGVTAHTGGGVLGGRSILLRRPGDNVGVRVSEVELRAASSAIGERIQSLLHGDVLFQLAEAAQVLGLSELSATLTRINREVGSSPVSIRNSDGTTWTRYAAAECSERTNAAVAYPETMHLVNEQGVTIRVPCKRGA